MKAGRRRSVEGPFPRVGTFLRRCAERMRARNAGSAPRKPKFVRGRSPSTSQIAAALAPHPLNNTTYREREAGLGQLMPGRKEGRRGGERRDAAARVVNLPATSAQRGRL